MVTQVFVQRSPLDTDTIIRAFLSGLNGVVYSESVKSVQQVLSTLSVVRNKEGPLYTFRFSNLNALFFF